MRMTAKTLAVQPMVSREGMVDSIDFGSSPVQVFPCVLPSFFLKWFKPHSKNHYRENGAVTYEKYIRVSEMFS